MMHPAREVPTAIGGSNTRKGGDVMEDKKIVDRINELAREEHALWERESRGQTSGTEQGRLKELQVTLDQCWDLLHQRRARRRAGQNPDEAKVRDPGTVEGYIG
jgi:hypothetical protein